MMVKKTPVAMAVKRSTSIESMAVRRTSSSDTSASTRKKAFKFRRGAILLSSMLMFISALVILSQQTSPSPPGSDQQQAQASRSSGDTGGPGSTGSVSGWELARQGFLLGGRGVLQAVGLTAVSAEEQQRVKESLQQSGDDDHEAEVVESRPVPSKRIRRTEAPPALESTRPAVVDARIVERVPLAGLGGISGDLALSDGTCAAARSSPQGGGADAQEREKPHDCSSHGFCSKGNCVCAVTYTGPFCSAPRRPFVGHLRAGFEGRFLLSATHVRRKKGVRYNLPGGPLEVPFARAGKVNRIVWAHLQRGALMKLEPVLSQALLDLLPGRDPLTNAMFRTCAVVANSGFHFFYPWGRRIDAHSMVVRILEAPTKPPRHRAKGAPRFATAVGRRTTFRVLDGSPELTGWQEDAAEIRVSPVLSKAGFFGFFQHLNRVPDARSYLLDSDFSNYVAESVGTAPTPLAIALLLALQKCTSVDVYGAHWHPGYGVPEVYYEMQKEAAPGKPRGVPRPQEMRLLEMFAKAGIVNLAHPCVAGCPAESGIPCNSCPLGSACACGRHTPLPVALPGFCHLPGNVTCFYKCSLPQKSLCQGGPGRSVCPAEVDLSRGCVEVHQFKAPRELPAWATARHSEHQSGVTGSEQRMPRRTKRGKSREV